MMRALGQNVRGSSAAEFGLVVPLLILLLFGVIDGGRYMWTYNQAEKATQLGARIAVVTNMVDPNISSKDFVGVAGLTQGDIIPTGTMGTVVCTNTACACAPSSTCIAGIATGHDQAAFDLILGRMQGIMPTIQPANLVITYRDSGVGYAGDPNGSDIQPLVSVSLTGVTFSPLASLMRANLTLPAFQTTLTSEDSAGTGSEE